MDILEELEKSILPDFDAPKDSDANVFGNINNYYAYINSEEEKSKREETKPKVKVIKLIFKKK